MNEEANYLISFNSVTLEPRAGASRNFCLYVAKRLAGSNQFSNVDVYLNYNDARIPIKLDEYMVDYDLISISQFENLIEQHYEAKKKNTLDPLWQFAMSQSLDYYRDTKEETNPKHVLNKKDF